MSIIGGYRPVGREGGVIIHGSLAAANGRDRSMFVLSNVVVGRKPATPAFAWSAFSDIRLYAAKCLVFQRNDLSLSNLTML